MQTRFGHVVRCVAALALMLFGSALAQAASGQTVLVKGVAGLHQRAVLPYRARMIVQIRDIALADAPARVLAEQIVVVKGRSLRFALPLNPAAYRPGLSTSVSIRIESPEGRLLWITDTIMPVPASRGRASINMGRIPLKKVD